MIAGQCRGRPTRPDQTPIIWQAVADAGVTHLSAAPTVLSRAASEERLLATRSGHDRRHTPFHHAPAAADRCHNGRHPPVRPDRDVRPGRDLRLATRGGQARLRAPIGFKGPSGRGQHHQRADPRPLPRRSRRPPTTEARSAGSNSAATTCCSATTNELIDHVKGRIAISRAVSPFQGTGKIQTFRLRDASPPQAPDLTEV